MENKVYFATANYDYGGVYIAAKNIKEAKHYVAWYLRKIDTLEELLAGKLLEDK